MQIIPTVLTNSQEDLENRLIRLKEFSQWIQIDVVDGRFAANRTFPLEWLNNYQDFSWDIHLMVDKPIAWLEKCFLVAASRIVGQIETMTDQREFVNRLINNGVESGLALDLGTPVEKLDSEALLSADLVLLLSVKAGFSGQHFNPIVFKKIEKLIDLKKELGANFKIAVDGGIDSREMIAKLEKSGVDLCYIGKHFLALQGDNL